MKKGLLIILTTLVYIATTTAQDNYQLKFKVKGLQKDSAVYLGNYLGKSLYYHDTAYVGKNGAFEFKSKDLKHGVYAVIVSLEPVKYFEILVNENKIEIESDINSVRESVKVKKSVENTVFYEYISYLNKQTKIKAPLIEQKKTITDKKKLEVINNQIVSIDKEVIKYQHNLVETHKGKYVSQLVNMSLEPSPVKIPEGIKDSAMYRYMHYRNHYFDNFDLKDDKLARTPIFHQRMDNYFMKVIPQDPDTICKEIFNFTDKMIEGGDMYKYTVNHLTYAHVKTKRMGMDNVYVRMAQRYYLSGKADWASEKGIEKMRKDVDKLDDILIGNPAPNIVLADTTEEKFVSLYKDMKQEYTILYFWDWTCGHCKKETPQLQKFYDSIKENTNIDLGVYAVCTKLENDGWRKFIKANNLTFTNVSDFPDLTVTPEKYGMTIVEIDGQKTLTRNEKGITINFQSTYDVFVTPQIFLLDKNKKIVAKQITLEQLGGLLNHLENKKQE
jgi:peroxiredoxin